MFSVTEARIRRVLALTMAASLVLGGLGLMLYGVWLSPMTPQGAACIGAGLLLGSLNRLVGPLLEIDL